jgi:uncharacterized protein
VTLLATPAAGTPSRVARQTPVAGPLDAPSKGQEAPIVIYTMATSSGDDQRWSMDFLHSLNRLMVAISRAQGMAVLVCSPALLGVHCRTADQLILANALCRLVEMAGEGEALPPHGPCL